MRRYRGTGLERWNRYSGWCSGCSCCNSRLLLLYWCIRRGREWVLFALHWSNGSFPRRRVMVISLMRITFIFIMWNHDPGGSLGERTHHCSVCAFSSEFVFVRFWWCCWVLVGKIFPEIHSMGNQLHPRTCFHSLSITSSDCTPRLWRVGYLGKLKPPICFCSSSCGCIFTIIFFVKNELGSSSHQNRSARNCSTQCCVYLRKAAQFGGQKNPGFQAENIGLEL